MIASCKITQWKHNFVLITKIEKINLGSMSIKNEERKERKIGKRGNKWTKKERRMKKREVGWEG